MNSRRALVAVVALVVLGGIAVAGPVTFQPVAAGSRIVHGAIVVEPTAIQPKAAGTRTARAAFVGGSPITYRLTATGTGTVGTTPFTEATFTLELTTDTSLIINQGSGVYATPSTTGSIEIAGFGVGTFTDVIDVFSNINGGSVGAVGFSHGASQLDLCDLESPVLAGYDLTTAIGPAFSSTLVPVSQFQNIGTSLGDVSFSSYHDGTFTATLGNGTAVPTASAPALMILAVLLAACGVVALRRFT